MVQDFSDALGLKIWVTWKFVVLPISCGFLTSLRCLGVLIWTAVGMLRTEHICFLFWGAPNYDPLQTPRHRVDCETGPSSFYEPCRCGAAVRHMKKLQPCLDAPDRAAHPATASFSETRNV